MLKKLRKTDEGFTIIEVMIVLAIAGMILLIVFLAIPALQRSSRNTQRKADVGNLMSAINNFVSNNGGTLPATNANFSTAFPDAANMSYYTTATNITWTNAGATVPASPTADPASVDKVAAASYMACNATNTAAQVGTSQRQVAIVYDIETSGGKTEQCISS